MNTLPQLLYRAAQVREMDRRAIADHGIPGHELMERAGAAVFNALRECWPERRRIAVICGSGNNGGDGYVVARLAHQAGLEVRVLQVEPVDLLKGDAHRAASLLIEAGVTPQRFAPGSLAGSELLVDALLGTGLAREVEGRWREAIDLMNGADQPVLSIDIPSGLHADSGAEMGAAVRADSTISFIGLKRGLFTGAGPDCSGHLRFHDLGVPPAVYEGLAAEARRITSGDRPELLASRPRTVHKGHFGHVLVVGGEHGMNGAVRLAGEAAARSGAGLVSVATRAAHAATLAAARPELMCHGVESALELAPLLARASVVAIGPGLGGSAWAGELFSRVVDGGLPLVVDADGLNLLAADPIHRGNWVLTPHPGEAARLLETSVADVEADRFAAVRAIVRRYGGACILKGAGSLAVAEEGMIGVCTAGNPGMASGGMGDLLTGIVAALLAQGLRLADAARLGVCLHAEAGDAAAAMEGERGLLAGDLMPQLRFLLNP